MKKLVLKFEELILTGFIRFYEMTGRIEDANALANYCDNSKIDEVYYDSFFSIIVDILLMDISENIPVPPLGLMLITSILVIIASVLIP